MLLYFFLLQQKTRRILCTLYFLVYFYCYNSKHALFFVPCSCCFTFTVTIENIPYSLYLVLVGLLLLLQQKTRLILSTLYLLVYLYCYNRKHTLFFVPCTFWLYFYCYNRKHALFFVPCTCCFTFTVTIENTTCSLCLVLVGLLLLLQYKTPLILSTLYLLVYFTVTIENTPYSLYLVLVGLLLLLQQKTRLILCTLYLLLYFYCYNRKHALFFVPCTCCFTFTVTTRKHALFFVPCTCCFTFYCYNRKHALFFVPCTCCFTFTVTIENTPYSLYLVIVGLLLLLQQKTRLILCTLYLLLYFYCYNRKHALFFVPCTFWFTFTVTIENTPYSLYLVLVGLLLLLQQKTHLILCTLYLLLFVYCYNKKHVLFFVPCTCRFTFTVTTENTPYSLYLVHVALLLLLQQKTRRILCTLYLLVYLYCYNSITPYSLYLVLVGLLLLLQQKTPLILCTLYMLLYFYCYNRKHAVFFVPCTCWFTFTVQQKTHLILCTLYLLVYFYCYNRKHAVFFVPCTCWFTFTVTIENTPYSLYLVLLGLLLLLKQKTLLILCTLQLLLYVCCYNRKHALFFVPCTCWFTFTAKIENTPYSLYLVLFGLLLLLQQKTRLILCTFYLLVYFYCYNRKHAVFFVPCTFWFTFTVTIENTPYSLYLVVVALRLLLQQKILLVLCTLYQLVFFYCYNSKHALFFVPCSCCCTFTVTIENIALFFVPCTCWFTFTVTIENTPYS